MSHLLIHRGIVNKQYKENLLKSFKQSFKKGYGIETDIHTTKDHEFICFHDFTLNRIFKKKGSVKNMEYSKIKKISTQSKKPIPLLKDLLKIACDKFKNKIAVALDVKDGLIALSGWKKQTNISAIDYIEKIQNFGVSRVIYTDINKDGTKQGPNIKDTVELSSKTKIPLVISGGVSSIEDIKKIKSLNNPNIEGVIIGKAIYDGDIKISDLSKLI